MGFDINTVLKDMSDAIQGILKAQVGEIKEYGKEVLENEKASLQELAEARIKGDIDDAVFEQELAREMKVIEAELLTAKIMTKVAAQKATNAAIDILTKAVKAAIL